MTFSLSNVTSLSLVSINTHSRLNREYTSYTLKLVSHSRLLEFDLQRDFLFRSTSSLSLYSQILHSILDCMYSESLIRSSELITSIKQVLNFLSLCSPLPSSLVPATRLNLDDASTSYTPPILLSPPTSTSNLSFLSPAPSCSP